MTEVSMVAMPTFTFLLFLNNFCRIVISFISFLFISFMIWSFLAQHPSQFSLKTVQLLQQVQLSVVSHNPHPPA